MFVGIESFYFGNVIIHSHLNLLLILFYYLSLLIYQTNSCDFCEVCYKICYDYTCDFCEIYYKICYDSGLIVMLLKKRKNK